MSKEEKSRAPRIDFLSKRYSQPATLREEKGAKFNNNTIVEPNKG